MLNYLINPGQRRLLAFFLMMLILIAFASIFISEVFTRQLLAAQLEEKIALIGHLSEADLLQESDQLDHRMLSGLLDGRYEQQQLAAGRNWLAAYGFEQPDTWQFYYDYDNLRKTGFFFSFLPAAAGLILLGLTSYLLLTALYGKIRHLADRAQQMAADPAKLVAARHKDTSEGDLAVLEHAVLHLAEKASGRLKALEQDKSYLQNFLSDISHQIKTPLASLQLYFDLMLQNKVMPAEKREQFLVQGQLQINRIDWLIQGLLKMARLDAGSINMRKMMADLSVTAAQAIAPFHEKLEQRQIKLINKVPEETFWPHNPEWLAEAISNLIKNAIEQVPDGGTIEIVAEKTALSLQLHVLDNGPGVPPEVISKIFERFYKRSSASKPDSVGIGLSLARSIFEQNGAELVAGNRSGGGAVFTASFLKKS